ncbi:MAG TPA: hypothetical protein VFF06_11200 [Polyangia bacterium]|nr:hypothetical protein [Polyangia bacterium]
MRAALTLVLFALGCGSGAPMTPDDLAPADACMPAPNGRGDGAASCATSADCDVVSACVAGACVLVAGCAEDCNCPDGRACVDGHCAQPSGAACGPCDQACTASGGKCLTGGCAPGGCDDTTVFCARGFMCDVPAGKKTGTCVPTLRADCLGCATDGDCPTGEVCNVNNRQCVPAPTGPDARLEISALDFLADNGMGMMTKARNLEYSIGFFSRRDPSFDIYALASGACASQRSTFTENAPFPVGPLRDAGATLTLALPSKSIPFARQQDPDPNFGFTYSANAIMVADFTAGPASWTGTGGADVGAFVAAGNVPAGFVTTPDVLGMTAVAASAQSDLQITLDSPAAPGIRTIVEISYNEASGATVSALTELACRGLDGAASVTIPKALLATLPKSSALGLTVTRASVTDFTATGLQQGRAVFGMQQSGSVIVSP